MTLRSILSAAAAGRSSAASLDAPPSITDQVAVWWADDISLADNDPVVTWVDRVNSYSLTNASAPNRPVLKEGVVGGRNAVRFSSVDEQYLGYFAADPITTSNDGCVVAVLRLDVTDPPPPFSSNYRIWDTADSSPGPVKSFGASFPDDDFYAIISRADGASYGAYDSDGAVASDTFLIYEWSADGVEFTLRYNNLSRTAAAVGTNDGSWFGDMSGRDNFIIGARYVSVGVDEFLEGDIAFIGVYDSPLSAGDRDSLYSWIISTYGIGPPPVTDTAGVWLASDLDSLYSDTDPIDGWTDRVNGLELTALTTHRPTLALSSIGGRTAVSFNAASEQALQSATGSNPTSSEDGSIIAVIRPNNTAASKAFVGIASVPYDMHLYIDTSEYIRLNIPAGSTTDSFYDLDGAISVVSPSIVEFTSDGSDTNIYLNNALRTVASNNGAWTADVDFNPANTIFTIGSVRYHTSPTYYAEPFDGEIAFIGVYDTPVTGAERTALYAWLSDYYGIAI